MFTNALIVSCSRRQIKSASAGKFYLVLPGHETLVCCFAYPLGRSHPPPRFGRVRTGRQALRPPPPPPAMVAMKCISSFWLFFFMGVVSSYRDPIWSRIESDGRLAFVSDRVGEKDLNGKSRGLSIPRRLTKLMTSVESFFLKI